MPIYPGTLRGKIDINISLHVEGARPIRGLSGQLKGWEGAGDVNLARAKVDLFFDLIGNIRWIYDQTYQHLEATQGPGAAQAWHASQVAALERASRAKVKAIMLAMIPAFVLLLALVVWALFF
ncbi:MAG: hypothetical protein JRI68_14145 [Deltaproteobacteria bacterium]|nr:hypothetical protein [Deltaproteobacteria bacterium]